MATEYERKYTFELSLFSKRLLASRIRDVIGIWSAPRCCSCSSSTILLLYKGYRAIGASFLMTVIIFSRLL